MVEGKEEKMEAEQALHSERDWGSGKWTNLELLRPDIPRYENENALVPGYASSHSCGDCL